MIIFDKKKNEWLKKTRGISFEEIAEIIRAEAYLDFIENPARTRKNQYMLVIRLRGYVYTVPFIFDKDNSIILKTAYANRKYHKLYKDYL